MKPFDILRCSLDGVKLVEASAGTGKTFALAALYLRLILESGLHPPQILVVTYTEAATKELRDRIRTRLREAHQAFSEPEAAVADDLVQALVTATTDRAEAIRRLSQALSDFDQAAVFTIHGFCQRTLQENAFESGYLFDTELVTEQDDLKLEIVEDFWRQHFYRAPPFLVHNALERSYSPAAFMRMVKTSAIQPDIKVVPQVQPRPGAEIQERFAAVVSAIRLLQRQWPAAREPVGELLHSPALNATSYGAFKPGHKGDGTTARDDKIGNLLDDLERYLQVFDPAYPFPLPDKFDLLTTAKLQKATLKNRETPAHPVFELCDRISMGAEQLIAALDEHLLFLKTELFRYLQEELPARKRQKNIQHFDDLLLKLRDALQQPAGAALAAAVRSRYEAALIDEFQDTDPVQYAIFHKLFADAGRCLFLIGDPKQAIYSFRGADVFAYMEAARDIPDRFTLGINWRSEPALIQAVNTLFQTRPDPFVYPEIGFLEVKAPEGREPQALTLDGQPLSPLVIWFVRSDATAIEPSASRVPKGPARIAKGAAKPLILAALAAEIARLLSLAADGQVLVGDRPLRENDLAVLLRTNREAREVKETLAGLGIPAVLYSTDNVFDSREALEMERLLRAIATPHDERLLRAALATDMLGAKGDDLVQMATEAARWEELLLDFRGYAQLWAEHGFIRIFRRFMLDHGVRARLMGFPDGDRRLTNTLHLAEILHQEAVHEQLGMVDLLRWFAEQRNPDTRTTGEQQLRLESDDNAIKLVTIHKSKGLQYPVVFCPFLWEGSKDSRRDRTLLFHDETDARRLTLDLGTLPPEREQHQAMAARETLAENLRLLYVALTRAQKHCTLVWGCFNQADTAAPAYLFHHRGSSTSLQLADETEASFKALDDTAVINQLRDLERKAGKTITLCELPLTAGSTYTPVQTPPESLTARVFQGSIEHHWRVSSFSAITSQKPREGEWPDHDETDVPPSLAAGIGDAADIAVPPADIFRFPAGARPGTLLHDILEHLDFTSRDPEVMATLVGQKLEDYGFEPEWRATLCAMLDRLLKAPLGGPGWTFTLADIPNQDRLNELQFYFPLERLTPERLREAFASVAGEVAPDLAGRTADLSQPNTAGLSDTFLTPRSRTSWLNRLQLLDFTQVHGFMRGFMDLVFHFDNRFYLVDWKSNHLGDSVEDYDPRGLADAMVREYYLLQYHLYVVALDRYLAMRLPGYRYEDHFGGVYYVFLRGVHPDVGPHYGVFRDRPPQTLIETLSSTLLGERF